MNDDATAMLKESYSGYSTVRTISQDVRVEDSSATYGLLPVWKYDYTYAGKEYPFYVNGQSGKIIGEAPISKKKVWAYTGTLFGCITAILVMVPMLIAWL